MKKNTKIYSPKKKENIANNCKLILKKLEKELVMTVEKNLNINILYKKMVKKYKLEIKSAKKY